VFVLSVRDKEICRQLAGSASETACNLIRYDRKNDTTQVLDAVLRLMVQVLMEPFLDANDHSYMTTSTDIGLSEQEKNICRQLVIYALNAAMQLIDCDTEAESTDVFDRVLGYMIWNLSERIERATDELKLGATIAATI
jgi:hypothetical protein